MADNPLLEPYKAYNSIYKKLHEENVTKYFDELTKNSQIDTQANKVTVSNYNKALNQLNKTNSQISKYKNLKTLLLVLAIILPIISIFIIYLYFSSRTNTLLIAMIVMLLISIFMIVFSILMIKKKINPALKTQEQAREKFQAEANKYLNEAWAQMAGLNALYDWGTSAKLFTKTVPLIQLDQYFDEKKFTYLHEKYGLYENSNDNMSTYFCQSGSILGNPFLLCKDYHQNWINKAYSGSITIHWTERVRTKEGTRTVSRSQVLTATIYKPAPQYVYNTYLVYGNEAAPNLNFSRAPSNIDGLNEKEIDKKVKRKSKLLEKKAREAIIKNSNYTKLGNDEFEALFGGTDRDNEVEYRLLFTPLAQQNLLDLIKSQVPFGDDFWMQKSKELNFVQTEHSQNADYQVDPIKFTDFDYENARTKFINFNNEYFKNLYFELAPLLSIPLYQQHKSKEFIYDKEYKSNISSYEHETMANGFDIRLLKPDGAKTPSILKTNLIRKNGNADEVTITAHAFTIKRKVTYVSKFGGDGLMHSIPVFWLEYVPIEKTSTMVVEAKDSSRFDFNLKAGKKDFQDLFNSFSPTNGCRYERGLLAVLLTREITSNDINSVNKLFASKAVSPKTNRPTLEEIIKVIEDEKIRFEDNSTSNEEDEEATNKILEDDSLETEEVEVKDDDFVDPDAPKPKQIEE